ncbi:MAG: type II toxin-antitoxin system HicA family toxin [Chloroflexota bacterium]|nr:type II toxin-antitoxin system HicA family toxin [Chloroflexota bacterium]
MPRLPRMSGKQVIKALRKKGYEVFSVRDSHHYLHRWEGDKWSPIVTVAVHGNKILKLKTLKSILKQADLSVEEFIELL